MLVITILLSTVLITTLILILSYKINIYFGTIVEAIMTYQILATKCLKVESMKVYHSLKNQTLEEARKAVSMIVGRDTQCLDEIGVAKAAIETVAENTSDGVIAPMLYTALGGPILGFLYKAVNTMDSMIGYKNDKYIYFGRAAARLDDIVNFIPSRISAYIMIIASFLAGKSFSGKGAYTIYKRDNRKHASPNSAQTESVCAGALGLQLAGDASYFGKIVHKPFIGDSLRKVEYEDIRRANKLMYMTAFICEILCVAVMIIAKQILKI
jgi:adenosylcobinamide-phosphate synthase